MTAFSGWALGPVVLCLPGQAQYKGGGKVGMSVCHLFGQPATASLAQLGETRGHPREALLKRPRWQLRSRKRGEGRIMSLGRRLLWSGGRVYSGKDVQMLRRCEPPGFPSWGLCVMLNFEYNMAPGSLAVGRGSGPPARFFVGSRWWGTKIKWLKFSLGWN